MPAKKTNMFSQIYFDSFINMNKSQSILSHVGNSGSFEITLGNENDNKPQSDSFGTSRDNHFDRSENVHHDPNSNARYSVVNSNTSTLNKKNANQTQLAQQLDLGALDSVNGSQLHSFGGGVDDGCAESMASHAANTGSFQPETHPSCSTSHSESQNSWDSMGQTLGPKSQEGSPGPKKEYDFLERENHAALEIEEHLAERMSLNSGLFYDSNRNVDMSNHTIYYKPSSVSSHNANSPNNIVQRPLRRWSDEICNITESQLSSIKRSMEKEPDTKTLFSRITQIMTPKSAPASELDNDNKKYTNSISRSSAPSTSMGKNVKTDWKKMRTSEGTSIQSGSCKPSTSEGMNIETGSWTPDPSHAPQPISRFAIKPDSKPKNLVNGINCTSQRTCDKIITGSENKQLSTGCFYPQADMKFSQSQPESAHSAGSVTSYLVDAKGTSRCQDNDPFDDNFSPAAALCNGKHFKKENMSHFNFDGDGKGAYALEKAIEQRKELKNNPQEFISARGSQCRRKSRDGAGKSHEKKLKHMRDGQGSPTSSNAKKNHLEAPNMTCNCERQNVEEIRNTAYNKQSASENENQNSTEALSNSNNGINEDGTETPYNINGKVNQDVLNKNEENSCGVRANFGNNNRENQNCTGALLKCSNRENQDDVGATSKIINAGNQADAGASPNKSNKASNREIIRSPNNEGNREQESIVAPSNINNGRDQESTKTPSNNNKNENRDGVLDSVNMDRRDFKGSYQRQDWSTITSSKILCIQDHPLRGKQYFVAYLCVAKADLAGFGRAFYEELISWGFPVFLPEKDLLASGFHYENICWALDERCQGKIIIVLSKNFEKSVECRFITQYARNLDPDLQRRNLIPIVIDKECTFPRSLVGVTIINYFHNKRRGWLKKKIADAVIA